MHFFLYWNSRIFDFAFAQTAFYFYGLSHGPVPGCATEGAGEAGTRILIRN